VGIWLIAKRPVKSISKLDKVYLGYCDKLGKRGLARAMGEAPGDYAVRVKRAFPASASEIDRINGLYTQLSYEDKAPRNGAQLFSEFKRGVQRLKI
jgi:hypothetical protein